uniref:ADP-ribosyl cyclase/cyclic ADP-ribose hydrolase 1 n=1 Tax=Laticauda laticaudata TaxID=8630 RepID=A0A8C5WW82_LATLA
MISAVCSKATLLSSLLSLNYTNFLKSMFVSLCRNEDCFRVWKLFEQAFLYKDPCNVTKEDYQPLMDLARYSIPCNKSLFWSKTYDLAHHFTKTNHNFLTLEDTLLGYIADGITWCGNPSDSGINYESCPKWTECENNPSSVYWKLASKMVCFADLFSAPIIFGSVEIVNLNPEKVSKMQIWLMHDIGGPQSSIQLPRLYPELRDYRVISKKELLSVFVYEHTHSHNTYYLRSTFYAGCLVTMSVPSQLKLLFTLSIHLQSPISTL